MMAQNGAPRCLPVSLPFEMGLALPSILSLTKCCNQRPLHQRRHLEKLLKRIINQEDNKYLIAYSGYNS